MLKKIFRLYRDHYVALLRLGVPIMIGQLGIIIVGFADNMMVGHHTDLKSTRLKSIHEDGT